MSKLAQMLAEAAWTRGLTPEQRRRVEADTFSRVYPKGSHVFHHGERVDHWMGVVDGLGAPIAHGYLTLALVGPMAIAVGVIPPDAVTGLNYGLDKVRFIAPVRAGARVRNRVSLLAAEPQSGGRVLLKLHCTLQIEGEAKPALVAEMLCMLIGNRDASA